MPLAEKRMLDEVLLVQEVASYSEWVRNKIREDYEQILSERRSGRPWIPGMASHEISEELRRRRIDLDEASRLVDDERELVRLGLWAQRGALREWVNFAQEERAMAEVASEIARRGLEVDEIPELAADTKQLRRLGLLEMAGGLMAYYEAVQNTQHTQSDPDELER